MFHVLTEEESVKSIEDDIKKFNSWWESLSIEERMVIYNYHKTIFEQIRCSHKFDKTKFYSREIEHCNKCGYSRSLQDGRNEKISEII